MKFFLYCLFLDLPHFIYVSLGQFWQSLYELVYARQMGFRIIVHELHSLGTSQLRCNRGLKQEKKKFEKNISWNYDPERC